MRTPSFFHKKSVQFFLFAFWAFLFIALLQRDFFIDSVKTDTMQTVEQAESMEYQSIYFKKEKIGFVQSEYIRKGENLWELRQNGSMRLNVGGKYQEIELKLQAELDGANHLRNFTFTFHSPFYKMDATGAVSGNIVNYTLNSGSSASKGSLTFPEPPLLTASRRAYLLQPGLKEGDKRKIPWFDPLTLTGKETVVQYGGVEPVRIGGRVLKLHHFSESIAGTKINFWINDEGVTVKEESPAGFVFLKEPRFKAQRVTEESADLLAAVAVIPKTAMPEDVRKRSSMRYQLTLPEDIEFTLNGANQSFEAGILTVMAEDDATINCTSKPGDLAPSAYVQADNPEIIEQANEIIKGAQTEQEKVRLIAAWVFENLEKKPVIGLPDALTTLHNRRGDCNEHASLFAAFAKAAGIPTRIAAGVVYTDWGKAFYYHAWNEVCVDGTWLSIDTTTNQIPADVTHLKFVEGEMEEQARIGALIGQLEITPLP